MPCIFCDVITDKAPRTIIREDANTIVIQDIHPQAAIHYLVIPKRHAKDLVALSEDNLISIFRMIRSVIADHHIINFRVVHNGGGAQLIDHAHFHLMGSVDKHRDL